MKKTQLIQDYSNNENSDNNSNNDDDDENSDNNSNNDDDDDDDNNDDDDDDDDDLEIYLPICRRPVWCGQCWSDMIEFMQPEDQPISIVLNSLNTIK